MEQRIEHSPIRHPLGIVGGIAVQRILADIEEERAQIFVAEVGQRTDVGVEVEVIDRLLERQL